MFDFLQFEYDMFRCSCFAIYPAWCSELPGFAVWGLSSVLEKSQLLLQIFFLFFLFLSWFPITQTVHLLELSPRSWIFSFTSFHSFILFFFSLFFPGSALPDTTAVLPTGLPAPESCSVNAECSGLRRHCQPCPPPFPHFHVPLGISLFPCRCPSGSRSSLCWKDVHPP